MYCYMAACLFILIAFGYFLVQPDIDRIKEIGSYIIILSLPYLLSMFYSLVLWTINLTSMRIMIRGFMWPAYQLIAILMAASAIYCFGKDGVYYQLIAYFAGYVLNFVQIIRSSGGIGDFISEYVVLITSAGNDTGRMMHQVETMAYAHGMGIFLLFLVLTWKENKKNKWFFIPTLFFFLSGFKRSAMLGLLAAAVVTLLCYLFPKSIRKKTACFLCLLMGIGGILYIGILSSNDADMIIETLGINTMGRSEIYSMMRAFYEFSLVYLGKGLGYISYSIGSGLIDVGSLSRGDIHNDLLRQYIELGMMGYVVWLLTFYYWRVKEFIKKTDTKVGIFVLSCLGYCFACYMTENMYYRYTANLALNVVILSYAYGRKKKAEKETE